MLGEIEPDAPRAERFFQLQHALGGGDVNVRDAAPVHDDLLCVRLHGGENVLLKRADVGEKHVAAEAVDDRVLDRVRGAIAREIIEILMAGDHAEIGLRRHDRAHDDGEEAQQHADEHAAHRAEEEHAEEGGEEDIKLPAVRAQQAPRHFDLQNADERRDDDAREHRHGEQAQKRREKQQHEQHDRGGGEAHELALAAELIGHAGARDAAVDRAAARRAGGELHHGVGQQLPAVVHRVVIALGVAVRGEERLRHDDERDRETQHRDRLHPAREKRGVRHRKPRQTARHGGQELHAEAVDVDRRREQHADGHEHHRHRELRPELFGHENDDHRAEAEQRRERVKLRKLRRQMAQQRQKLARARAAAEELRHLHEDDRGADAGDEPAHDGRGNVLHDAAGAKQPEHEKPQPDAQRHDRDKRNGLLPAEDKPHRRERRADHDGGHRVHADDKLRRRRDETEQQNRQQRAVKPIDRRQPRDLGIAHRDRDGDKRDNHPGEDVRGGIL